MDKNFVLKGDICYSKNLTQLETIKNGYLVCRDGFSAGVFASLPDEFKHLECFDYTDKLIVPGLTDLHVHAPQYSFRALGMDMELLDWLNTYTFPEESKYSSLDYAEAAYRKFAEDLLRGPNTRSCIFATLHIRATVMLMEMLEANCLCSMVGKVNMDRNAPDNLCEKSADESAENTMAWLQETAGRFKYTKPILTPRFIPSCSDELMYKMKQIQKSLKLPVQSHLSENPGEVAWVKELCPDASSYGDAYNRFGLFGGRDCPTVMAHCVYSENDEIELMRKNNVFVAHCPDSNTNLASGIAPVRKFLQCGLNVGLGSDVAGGTHTSIFKAMADAIKVSKLRWRLLDSSLQPLTVAEAFYLGTIGGGSFFGKVGSFDAGYEFDAVVIDDTRFNFRQNNNLENRLDQTIYLSESRDIIHKFVQGRKLF